MLGKHGTGFYGETRSLFNAIKINQKYLADTSLNPEQKKKIQEKIKEMQARLKKIEAEFKKSKQT